jgi:hypothetical protein
VTIDDRIRKLEKLRGKRIVLRGVRTSNKHFRGRLVERHGYIVLEYRDDQPGYFWHYEIIEELLGLVEKRSGNIILYEGDYQYMEVPVR